MKLINTIKKDFFELSFLWKLWLAIGLSAVIFTNFYHFESLISLLAGLSGVAYVLNTAHDNRSAMIFGAVTVFLYGIISLSHKVYGDATQNLLYQLPVLVCGLTSFNRTYDKDFLSYFRSIDCKLSIPIWVVTSLLYGMFLKQIGDAQPYFDSFTTITSMFAIILLAMRSKYQWYLWILVNLVSIAMWYSIGGISVMSVMWTFYLFNSFIGFYVNVIKSK